MGKKEKWGLGDSAQQPHRGNGDRHTLTCS